MSAGTEVAVAEVCEGVAVRQSAGTIQKVNVSEIVEMVKTVDEIRDRLMKDGVHYGLIPGCGDKPALMKPGAEKLCLGFRLEPEHEIITTQLGGEHREITVKTKLRHIGTGNIMGSGVGSCSTMESKYRWRKEDRACPHCGVAAIIKGKEEYGGGWLCFAKRGGCGAKWPDGAQEIEGQQVGRIENPDVADQYNTVLKMAKKRSLVDATLTTLGVSDKFTQDVEESGSEGGEPPAKKTTAKTGSSTNSRPPASTATAPPASGSGNIVKGIVDDTSIKEGGTKEKPWTKYGVKVGGDWYSTFSDTLGVVAKIGQQVVVEWKADGKYRTLVGIVAAPGDAPATAGNPESAAIRAQILKEQARLNVPSQALKDYSRDVLDGKAFGELTRDEAAGLLEWMTINYDPTVGQEA